MLFFHTPNPDGRYIDGDGRRYEILTRQDQETFNGGGTTYKMGGVAYLRPEAWGKAADINQYAALNGLVNVQGTTVAPAVGVSYSPAVSLLAATDVQAAIDEVDARIDAIDTVLTAHELVDNGDGSFTHKDGLGTDVTVFYDVVRDWAPATAYQAGQVVTESDSLYRRLATGTSLATFAADMAAWTPIGASTVSHKVDQWAASTAYEAGEVVIFNGELYRRIASGTSGASFDAAEAADWAILARVAFTGANQTTAGVPGDVPAPLANQQNRYLTGDGTWDSAIPEWEATHDYEAGDIVRDSDKIYYANFAHTSGATFAGDIAVWTQLSAGAEEMTAATTAADGTGGSVPAPLTDQQNFVLFGDATWGRAIREWEAGHDYEAGDYVFAVEGGDTTFWTTVFPHTSNTTFAADSALWTAIDGPTMVGANSVSIGVKGNVPAPGIGEQNKFLRGDADFGSSIPEWATPVNYSVGDVVRESDKIYYANTAHASGVSLAADVANWTELSAAAAATPYTGANTGAAGTEGIVPAPAIDQQNKVLRGDGTWGFAIRNWASGVEFEPGDFCFVSYQGGVGYYYTSTAHVSGATFSGDAGLWTKVDGPDLQPATSAASGVSGNVPNPGIGEQNQFLRGDATFGSAIPEWVTATDYTAGDVVRDSDQVFYANTTHTAGATFAGDAANWTALTAAAAPMVGASTTADGAGGSVPAPLENQQNLVLRGSGTFGRAIPAWGPSVIFESGDLCQTYYNGIFGIWFTTVAHTAAGTFAADIAKWNQVTGQEMVGATTGGNGKFGLVPAPTTDSQNQFLRGDATFGPAIPLFTSGLNYEVGDVVVDATDDKIYRCITPYVGGALRSSNAANWDNIGGGAATTMVGASTTADGTAGGAPQPLQDQQNKVLMGDGTWESPIRLWEAGLTWEPGDLCWNVDPDGGYSVYFTGVAHTAGGTFVGDAANWIPLGGPLMTPADASTGGDIGNVFAPAAGDQNKYFRADGTYASSIPAWSSSYDYSDGDVVREDGKAYVANVTHTSGPIFDVDRSNWDIVGGGQRYERVFTATDVKWNNSLPGYWTVFTAAALHNVDPVSSIDVYELIGTEYVSVEVDKKWISAGNDVNISVPDTFDFRFAGKVVISS